MQFRRVEYTCHPAAFWAGLVGNQEADPTRRPSSDWGVLRCRMRCAGQRQQRSKMRLQVLRQHSGLWRPS